MLNRGSKVLPFTSEKHNEYRSIVKHLLRIWPELWCKKTVERDNSLCYASYCWKLPSAECCTIGLKGTHSAPWRVPILTIKKGCLSFLWPSSSFLPKKTPKNNTHGAGNNFYTGVYSFKCLCMMHVWRSPNQ